MATTIPEYSGSVPNKATDSKESWSMNVYNMMLWLANSFTTKFNLSVTEVEVNRSETQSKADEVTENLQATIDMKDETKTLRDEAVNAVSQLPDGAINDATISELDTWSSAKLDAMQLKYTAIKTADYTANLREIVPCDTSDGSFVATLPLDPGELDEVVFWDIASSFKENPLSVARNGSLIMGLDEDTTISSNNIYVRFVFINNNWRVIV